MIKLTELSEEEALKAMTNEDFPGEILGSAPRVIIILTQSWCPDWIAQRSVFAFLPERDDLKVYFLEYDRKDYGRKIMEFKETVFKNDLIPYLRFYENGKFTMDSNYCSRKKLTRWLEETP